MHMSGSLALFYYLRVACSCQSCQVIIFFKREISLFITFHSGRNLFTCEYGYADYGLLSNLDKTSNVLGSELWKEDFGYLLSAVTEFIVESW